MEKLNLENTHADYNSQTPNWQKILDCYIGGGNITDADDDEYLIKKGSEDDDDYDARKRRTIYYNKCYQVVQTFQGHLWRKSPIRQIPDELLPLLENVDRCETRVNEFFQNVSQWSQVYGIYFVLIDYPVNDNQNLSKRDEEMLGLRPYFSEINPSNVLDWQFDINTGKLNYVVIREIVESENNAPFKKAEYITQYRLLTSDKIQIYKYSDNPKDKRDIVLVNEYINTLGEIPLVPFYAKKKSFFVGRSILHDIVDLNLELYNKHSDKDNSEFWTAHPNMFFKGFDRSELTISPAHAIFSSNEKADFSIVEFSGLSINELRKTEADILREIYDIALKQIRNPSVARQTYESKRLDRIDALSELQSRAVGYSESEKKCWQLAAKWLKINDRDIDISYNIDYNTDSIDYQLVQQLIQMKNEKLISHKTFSKILVEGEVLPNDYNVEEDQKQIEQENNINLSSKNQEQI